MAAVATAPAVMVVAHPPSLIDYLASHHAAYTNTGTAENPSARFDDTSYSLSWLIATQTAEQAENLQKHIEFMGTAMENGGNPREWDKLFLADAYMKTEHRYETRVSVSELSWLKKWLPMRALIGF